MLSTVLMVIGGVLVLGAALALASGMFVVFLPQLLFLGLVLLVGLAIERWRYKPTLRGAPDPRWTDTGERIVDPDTGALTAVYFDPASGERHYVALPPR